MTDDPIYYLESISRQLKELHDFAKYHPGFIGPSIGTEILADNRDWLSCYIDKLRKEKTPS